MAKLSMTPMMGWTQFNKSITAVPEYPWDVAFDSEFEKSVMSDKNHTLKRKNIESPKVTGNNHDHHVLHILLSLLYTPIRNEKSKKFSIYIIV